MIDQKSHSYVQRLYELAEMDLISLDSKDYLQETLKRIVVRGNELIPSDLGVHIILWDKEHETFNLSATSIEDLSSVEFCQNTRSKGGITRFIIDTKKIVVVNNVDEDPFLKGRKMKDHGVQSYFGVPMVIDDEAVGVLFIFNSQPMEYLKQDIQFSEVLAKRAADAVKEANHLLELEQKATRDGLTGLLNKATFLEIAEKLCKESTRHHTENSLIFLDLDDFKEINDEFGHAEGDRILQLVAQVIQSSVREMDIAARYGGDEFMILFPGTSAVDLDHISNRLKQGFLKMNRELGNHSVIISMGGATSTADTCDIKTLIEAADKRMYHRKRTGKLVVD